MRGELPETFAHDPAGTLLGSRQVGSVQGNRPLLHSDRHLEYDAQHHLIQATLPDGRAAHYRYDAFGRRIAKTVAGRTTEFLWQGDRLVAESGPDGYRSYLYEPGTFRPLALLDGEGPAAVRPYHYHLDHLGTPQELTDARGTLAWSARYRAYGNLARLDIEHIAQPLRFQGQYHDPETGLHYNRHRYYHPETGSFITPDPIRLAGGLNSYRYAPNPIGWVDPLGLANVKGQCPSVEKADAWTFKSDVDLDRRSTEGTPYTQLNSAKNEAFILTGVRKEEFTVTKWAKDQYGKSHPVEWRVLSGRNKGAEVNIDDPTLVPSVNGPKSPHIGYQTPGKRGEGGARRGHILILSTPISRSRIGIP